MNIRESIKEDIPQLVEMVFQYKRSQFPEFEESRKQVISATFENIINQSNTKALVYLNSRGSVTGYIVFHLLYYPMIAGKEIYVSDLLISENERGKGIGSSLLAEAEQFAMKNKCVRLMLNNPKESEGYERGFYKRHGFTDRTNFANFVKIITE